jgi:hypothetical protein
VLPARQFPGAGLVIVAACILAIGLALLALSPNYGRQFDPGLPPHRDARVTINAAYGGYGKLRDDDTLIVNEHITLGQVSARGGGILDIAVPDDPGP